MKKISRIEFGIIEVASPEFPPPFQGVHITINGTDFLTIVSDFEKPYKVADGFNSFEEKRTWPIAHKNNLMTLRGAREYYSYYSIIDCECRCDGCWPLNGKNYPYRDLGEMEIFFQRPQKTLAL